jgi:hypothetical protein
MQRLLMTVVSYALTVFMFVAQISGDTRTAELLAQARAALGGDSKLAGVKAFSGHGIASRAMGEMQIGGELDLALQLPDKMLRSDSMSPMGDATIVTETGVNGDTLLRHTSTIGGGPNMVIRMPPPPARGSDAETQALRASRAELTRLSLAFLLTSPASMPLEYSYGGEAEADDGKADIVDVKGPSSFVARLFLDKATHRPLMLSYKGVAPRMVMSTTTQHGGAPDPAKIERDQKDAPAAMPPPQIVDISMFFDDYRQVDGVWLPHHVTRSIDGKTNEEWTFKTMKINPAFPPDLFAAK